MTADERVSAAVPAGDTSRRSVRARVVLRLVLALGVSAGLCEAVWRLVPHRLSVTTDIVGFPIFYHFDATRYFDAFYLIAIAFPLAAVLLYAYLPVARGGGGRPPRTPVRPVSMVEPEEPTPGDSGEGDGGVDDGPDDGDRGRGGSPGPVRTIRGAARVLLPGFAVAVSVGVVASGNGPTLSAWAIAAGAGYCLGVVALTSVLCRRESTPAPLGMLSAVNGASALVVVPLLYFVSRSSTVLVASDHHLRRYPWMAWWLVIPATVALSVWYARRLRTARSDRDVAGVEAVVLTYVVGVALLFVLIARLAAPLDTTFAAFDQAQSLASAQLSFGHGLFPWRDLYVIHGVFGDILAGQLGMSVFSSSRWGSASGFTVFLVPMLWGSLYVFTAYFARRNRLLVAGFVAVAVLWLSSDRLAGAGLFLGRDVMGYAQGYFRFAFLPLVLVLFDQTIRRRRGGWCAGLMAALVVQAIIVPETAIMAAGLLATLVVYEWLARAPGAPWRGSLMRTWWCAGFGLLFLGAWAVFLGATGSLRGFIDYYEIFGPGHTLSGAEPAWWVGRQLGPTVEFVVPVALLLLTVGRMTVALRRRNSWCSRDWVMVAAASFVLLYYQKVLARADQIHVAEVFIVTLPLVLLWLIVAAEALDDGVRRLARRALRRHEPGRARRGGRAGRAVVLATRHPATLAIVVALVALAPTPVGTLEAVAGSYHVTAPGPPVLTRLGYSDTGVIDTTMVHDLDAVLRRYAGPGGPVFDFNDEPGLLYYLLNRVPGTRFFHVSMADTGFAQRQLISDLTRSRPRLVVLYGEGIGLPHWDGIQATVRHYDVSDYLLDHYVPLANVDGQWVMIRSDLAASAPALPALLGSSSTRDFYLSSPECAWGFSPNFLHRPATLGSQGALSVDTHVSSASTLLVTGFTVDRAPGQAPLRVLAVRNGVVVATAVPNAKHSTASPNSDFTMVLPTTGGDQPWSFYVSDPDGTVSPMTLDGAVPRHLVAAGRGRTVSSSDGVAHTVSTHSGGVVSSVVRSTDRMLALSVAPGTDLAGYHWLELTSPARSRGANYSVTDGTDQSPDAISFSTLPRSTGHVFVQIGSCPQWRGFEAAGLSLVQGGGPKSLPVVRLVR
jgi:hypothetical protein